MRFNPIVTPVVLAALASVSLAACTAGGPPDTVGTWEGDRGSVFTFNEDMTFEYRDFAFDGQESPAHECVVSDVRVSGTGEWRQGGWSSDILLDGDNETGSGGFLLNLYYEPFADTLSYPTCGIEGPGREYFSRVS